MSARRLELPVLIVGAGPAGLMAAIALGRAGIDCVLVERRRELSSLPRATAISTRSMELLRSWGLEEAVRAGGIEVDWRQWYCETMARADDGYGRPTGFPTREQSAVVSPTSPACVPQDHLEPVLLDHFRSLAVGHAELGTEVTGVEHRPDGVRVALRDVARGGSRVVDARYLIAADGAHSTARRALGIEMRGPDRLVAAVSGLFRAPLWELVGDLHYGLYAITHPQAEGVFLPAGGGDRWLYGMLHEPGSPVADLTQDGMAQRIALAAGVPDLRPRIERTGRFSFAAQVAKGFRAGNSFLVGDAAHRATPRGGTGMNTAMHDGYDLGWKLAWVLRGWAEPELLDSYEAERRPVAEHNVARSADAGGTAREAGHELQADLGGRIGHAWTAGGGDRASIHAWTAGAGDRVSTLDLLGPGLTLFTGPEPTPWLEAAAAVRGPSPLTVRSLDAITARAIGIRAGGALLVRPDGVPVDWFAPRTRALPSLRTALTRPLPAADTPKAA
jgi:putative polyketide hydroxylase